MRTGSALSQCSGGCGQQVCQIYHHTHIAAKYPSCSKQDLPCSGKGHAWCELHFRGRELVQQHDASAQQLLDKAYQIVNEEEIRMKECMVTDNGTAAEDVTSNSELSHGLGGLVCPKMLLVEVVVCMNCC